MEIVLMADQWAVTWLTWARIDAKHKTSLEVLDAIHKSGISPSNARKYSRTEWLLRSVYDG
jgi:hypothetical protein